MPEQNERLSLDAPAPAAEQMLTEDAVAAILDVSTSWLAKARMRGEGPPYIKVGRSVRYFPLDPWLAAQRRWSTKSGNSTDEPNNGPSQYITVHENE